MTIWLWFPQRRRFVTHFVLNAFHATVGTLAVSPPPLAIASATFILVVAFGVPFLGLALACRPTSNPGSRRLAYTSVVSPTLYVFLGVVQALIKSPYSRRGRLVHDLARNRDLVAVCPRAEHCDRACSRGVAGCPRGNGRRPVPICGVSSHQSSVRLDQAGCSCGRYEDRARGLSLCRRRTVLVAVMLFPDRHWPFSGMAVERRSA